MTIADQLRAAGYTHRPPTEADRRKHERLAVYARAIVDSRGECVAVLTAREVPAWLEARSRGRTSPRARARCPAPAPP